MAALLTEKPDIRHGVGIIGENFHDVPGQPFASAFFVLKPAGDRPNPAGQALRPPSRSGELFADKRAGCLHGVGQFGDVGRPRPSPYRACRRPCRPRLAGRGVDQLTGLDACPIRSLVTPAQKLEPCRLPVTARTNHGAAELALEICPSWSRAALLASMPSSVGRREP